MACACRRLLVQHYYYTNVSFQLSTNQATYSVYLSAEKGQQKSLCLLLQIHPEETHEIARGT